MEESNKNVKDVIKAFFEPVLDRAIAKNSKDEEEVKEEVKEEEKAENKCKNEEVDKRKLIDEVAGMMKSAGCSDEIIKTAIKDMEKESYDKSEADDKADNSKAKNEEDKKEEDKKAKCEDDEEKEEEYKELKEKTEEEAMNKAKNEIFGDATSNQVSYISREERIERGMQY